MMDELEKTVSDELHAYSEANYTPELVSVMLCKDSSNHFSINVDSMNLFDSCISFAHYLFQSPRKALILLDDAFRETALHISKTHPLKTDLIYKENLHVRLVALPHVPEIYRTTLPNCSDIGQFICISGTVVRASGVSMLEYKKLWRCSKCKYQFIVTAEVDQSYLYEKPVICLNPEWCNGTNFTLMSTDINKEWCKDYQEIKVQEQVHNLTIGTVPKSMWVILEDDLVETCYAGNDINVSGAVIRRWKPLVPGKIIDIDLVLLAHNIEVKNKMTCSIISKEVAEEFGKFWVENHVNPIEGRNFILSSICPQVFGMYIVKLAVALVLAGGVQKKDGNSKIRGDSHLLLIGDPGTAKSQFLKYASKVSTRSVLTSGIGTTNAGLTVSAVKDGGKWQLEAGALVLADGGVCCIDEFSCIKEQDKTCIHEAMEQQTISVAKAGLVCSLSTRCSIFAATNPKGGKYDENLSLSENTALGSPLLSRFDIILVLLDMYDEKWDKLVSDFILEGRNALAESSSSISWPVTKMKNYFSLIRYINPKVTSDCERILQAYYRKKRSLQMRNAARTTPRLLQSLIRLAEGHARLMFRNEVLIIDAIIAIVLVESSMLEFSILQGLSPLQTVFPENPHYDYEDKAKKVLELLELNDLIQKINSYKECYQENAIRRSLFEISTAWSSKESFVFDKYNTSVNMKNYGKELSHENERPNIPGRNTKKPFKENKNLNEKIERSQEDLLNLISMNETLNKPSWKENMETDILQHEHFKHNQTNAVTNANELKDEISTLSDLKNIFSEDLLATSSKSFEKQTLDYGNMKQHNAHASKESLQECGTLNDQFTKKLIKEKSFSEDLLKTEYFTNSSIGQNSLNKLVSLSKKLKERKVLSVNINKNFENPPKYSEKVAVNTAEISAGAFLSSDRGIKDKQFFKNIFTNHNETSIADKSAATAVVNQLTNKVHLDIQNKEVLKDVLLNPNPPEKRKMDFDTSNIFSKYAFKSRTERKRNVSENQSLASETNFQDSLGDNPLDSNKGSENDLSGLVVCDPSALSTCIKNTIKIALPQKDESAHDSNVNEQLCNFQSCYSEKNKDTFKEKMSSMILTSKTSNIFEKHPYKNKNLDKELYNENDVSPSTVNASTHETSGLVAKATRTTHQHFKQCISSSQSSQVILKKIFGDSKTTLKNSDFDLEF